MHAPSVSGLGSFSGMLSFISIIIVALLLTTTSTAAVAGFTAPPRPPYRHAAMYGGAKGLGATPRSDDLIAQCAERYIDTRLDHFTWVRHNETFKMRYYTCDRHWKRGGTIFFYLGNEADVTLYLNNTGLMWELAHRFDAMLVFAEHRYYGKSKPNHANRNNHTSMAYLTSEQAMADYAALIWHLKADVLRDLYVPVIGFGGSYGGMLATWFRLKYPHLMDGAIAGSAPIWTYLGEDPPYDPGSFAEIVTRDASPEKGSSNECASNSREAWKTMFELGKTSDGRYEIAKAMNLCDKGLLDSTDDVIELANWAQNAWDYLAMGDYPYPSSYILNGEGVLPAFPVREACKHLAKPGMSGLNAVKAMASAIGVFYNFSGTLDCYNHKTGAGNATAEDADFWGYQYCTEQFQPFTRDGRRDMFWDQPFDSDQVSDECHRQWGVRPSPYKPTVEWGGRRIEAASNIVFSNGGLDPWSGGGVLDSLSDSLIAVIIPEGAHHLDLMFSHPRDPDSVKEARKIQEHHIRRWVEQARSLPRQLDSVA